LVASGELAQRINMVDQADHFLVCVCLVATLNLLIKQIRRIVFDIGIEAKRPAVSVICSRNNRSEDLLLILEVIWRSSPKEAVAFKIDIIWWLIYQKTFKTQI